MELINMGYGGPMSICITMCFSFRAFLPLSVLCIKFAYRHSYCPTLKVNASVFQTKQYYIQIARASEPQSLSSSSFTGSYPAKSVLSAFSVISTAQTQHVLTGYLLCLYPGDQRRPCAPHPQGTNHSTHISPNFTDTVVQACSTEHTRALIP